MIGRLFLHATIERQLSTGRRALSLAAAVLVMSAWITAEPSPKGTSATEPQGPAQSRPAGKTEPETPYTPQSPRGTGQTHWAAGFSGQLLRGLDGELYQPYDRAAIKHVQSRLKERGLYEGPLNGILDAPTMQSVLAFQQANPLLQRCGIPTPITRKLLEQGSHTDAATLKQAPVNGRVRQ